MPFPLTADKTPQEIEAIIGEYWTDLRAAIGNNKFITASKKNQLVDDYCAIGAFLSSQQDVMLMLEPLELAIRTYIRSELGPQLRAKFWDAFPKNAAGVGAAMKTHKILSGVLRASEAEGGFNHEKIVTGTLHREIVAAEQARGTLHSTAKMGTVSGKTVTFTDRGRSPEDKVNLPSGVPTIRAQLGGFDGKTFNQVLLRHGYQFKDVGAGAYHGEYTHRLQWYAIMKAQRYGLLTLHNSPLEIYKSLGYTTAQANKMTGEPGKEKPVVPEGRHLYLWEMLFDAGTSDTNAVSISGTLSHSAQTFHSPETMNKELMKLVGIEYRDTDVSNLWCLRLLLKTRWKKRIDETQDETRDFFDKVRKAAGQNRIQAIMTSDYTPKVKKGEKADPIPVPNLDVAAYALVWHLASER